MREPVVIDTNVILSALISDARSRELIVYLDERFVTPPIVREEVERNLEVVERKSGMDRASIRRTLETLFEHVELLDPSDVDQASETAGTGTNPTTGNDSIVLAAALALDGSVWSDDSDFQSVASVPVYSTGDVVEIYQERD